MKSLSPSNGASNPQVKINPKYASLVPELSAEEYESLKQSIKENGLYIPLIVNQDGIVLDGHHRFKACQEVGIQNPNTVTKEFKDKLDEQLFVIDCNLKRRQLNNFQRTELALKSKSILTEIAKKNMSLGGKGSKSLETLDSKGVGGEIGKLAGVSHETVRKVEKILASEYVTEKIKEGLRVGAVSINQAYEIVEEEERQEELNEEYQSFHKKFVEAKEERDKAEKTLDEYDVDKKKATYEEHLKLFRTYLEKDLGVGKAIVACIFWIAYRVDRKSDVEAAIETLKQIEEKGKDNEHGTQVWAHEAIEKMLYHAVAENKIDKSKIRDSKVVQDQLQVIRLKEEAANRELGLEDEDDEE